MENQFKNGDKVTFNLEGRQLSGRIVGVSYGNTYRVGTEIGYFVLHSNEFSVSGTNAVTDISDVKSEVKDSNKLKRPKKEK